MNNVANACMHKIRYMKWLMHYKDMQIYSNGNASGKLDTHNRRITCGGRRCWCLLFVVQCCEREQTEQEKLVRRYTRKAERRHERPNTTRIGSCLDEADTRRYSNITCLGGIRSNRTICRCLAGTLCWRRLIIVSLNQSRQGKAVNWDWECDDEWVGDEQRRINIRTR